MFYIIVGGITFIAFILLIVVIIYNRFQFCIVKMEEAEANIGIDLAKKLELIRRAVPIIKDELNLTDFLNEALEVSEESLNHFELNYSLDDFSKKMFSIIDDNDKLYKSEALKKILDDYNSNEIDLIGSIKFYNDTVVNYNHLILSFPSNIVRCIFGYKKKDFYTLEKRETFEIMKDEKK